MSGIICRKLILVVGAGMMSMTAQADIVDFDFTGRLIVADGFGTIYGGSVGTYTPIAASLSYNTVTGVGTSGLSITMSDPFLGSYATFHDISMTLDEASGKITGEILVDWASLENSPLHIEWDATGLLNAIGYGLQAGDVLSGSTLYHDVNGNGVQDIGEYIMDIGSASPYSSLLEDAYYGVGLNPDPQGPAPLAATGNSLGLLDTSTGLAGMRGYFDIGSGNSMHVTSVSPVPIPAAVWLFGSGLLGLMGIARCKE